VGRGLQLDRRDLRRRRRRDPVRLDAYLEAEGVDVAIMFCEYSPLSTGIQPIDDLLPIAAHNPARLRFLASVNPHLHDPLLGEVERQLALGAVALKLHPVHARFSPNDAVLWPVYARLEEAGMAVVFHCGTSVFPGAVNRYADPGLVDEVAAPSPTSRSCWPTAAGAGGTTLPPSSARCGPTCGSSWRAAAEEAAAVLPQLRPRPAGAEVHLRTDWPGVPGIARNAAAVADLGFDRDTLELIFWRNAFSVYALGEPPSSWE